MYNSRPERFCIQGCWGLEPPTTLVPMEILQNFLQILRRKEKKEKILRRKEEEEEEGGGRRKGEPRSPQSWLCH